MAMVHIMNSMNVSHMYVSHIQIMAMQQQEFQ